jgi:hypothetical protein
MVIVEHYAMNIAGGKHTAHIIYAAGLYLYLKVEVIGTQIIVGALYSLLYAAAEIYMIILEHHHIVEPHTVIAAAPYTHSFLLAHTEERCGFAGVEYLGSVFLYGIYISSGTGSYAAHALHTGERQPLCLENGMYSGRHFESGFSGMYGIAIFFIEGKYCFRFQVMKYLLCQLYARQQSIFLDAEYSLPPCIWGYTCQGGKITTPNIFLQCRFYKFPAVQYVPFLL